MSSQVAQLFETVTTVATSRLSEAHKQTLFLRTFGLLKIPLLLFCSPSITHYCERSCVVRIPLNRRTRNHLGSLYFGALAIGADCAGGFAATQYIRARKASVSFIFADFQAKFLKRPEADTFFRCDDGQKMRALVDRAIQTGERVNDTTQVVATAPDKSGSDPVATFTLTVSLRARPITS